MTSVVGHRYEHGFFAYQHVDEPKKQHPFNDLGDSDGDSLLRGVAAVILDRSYIRHPIDQAVLNKVMDWYMRCHREDRKISSNVNATERLQQLLRHVRIGKLTQKMALTLEKIIIDELDRNKKDYPDLFINGQLSPSAITHNNGWSYLTALCAALKNMPLEVQVVGRNRPLFKRECFNTDPQNPESVVLETNNGYFKPRLVSHIFNSAQILPVSQLRDAADDRGSFSKDVKVVSAEQEHLVCVFENVYRRLLAMVVAEELDADTLREVYTKSTTERSEHQLQSVGQTIFDGVVATLSSFYKLPLDSQEAQYAFSIAKAVSFGEMVKEDVFNQVEALQIASPTSLKLKH